MEEKLRHLKYFKYKKNIFVLTIFWTLIVFGSLFWNLILQREGIIESARIEARTSVLKDIGYRYRNISTSGVHVLDADSTPSSLSRDSISVEDITTQRKDQSTKSNAFNTRNIGHETSTDSFILPGHITSFRSLQPENSPDSWESIALQAFENGSQEYSSEIFINSQPYLRLMKPLITTESCLECHASQGYKLNEIRGGISVSTPLNPLLEVAESNMIAISIGHFSIWLIGFLGIIFGTKSLNNRYIERDSAISDLQTALDRIKVLDGLVPICANCKKIRDDKGYWNQIEEYITEHSDAEFSHGMCPDCIKVL